MRSQEHAHSEQADQHVKGIASDCLGNLIGALWSLNAAISNITNIKRVTCLPNSTETILIVRKIPCKRACAHKCYMDAWATLTAMCICNIELQRQLHSHQFLGEAHSYIFFKSHYQDLEIDKFTASYKTHSIFPPQWDHGMPKLALSPSELEEISS